VPMDVGSGIKKVWDELVGYWPRESRLEVDDGGGCHGYYVIYGLTIWTISMATEHLGRI
jgi:hypothetical protein